MNNPFSALAIIAEQRIQEAQEKGEFANLPGAGKPLKLEDLSNVPEELRMAYKILKNAGCLPPELSERKEMAVLGDLLDACPDERERVRAMKKLRLLLERARSRPAAMPVAQNDEYLDKILAKLERHERKCKNS